MLTSDEGIETRLSEPEIADIVRVYLLDEFLLGVGSVDR